ncbi:MAG: restriction endonuclease subunit S, partial [Bdellovibrionales bacterium]|nr:restriction endonuclease subunit S [Bdellovibrionales bacterium]
SSQFLFWWFKSIAQMIVAEGTGATVQGVKLPFIKSLKIPIPPIENQNIIVNKLDSIKKKSEHLETIYQKKLVALEELKKSLLHQAFNGEL